LASTFARGRAFFADADLLLFVTALALAIVVVPPGLTLVRGARSQVSCRRGLKKPGLDWNPSQRCVPDASASVLLPTFSTNVTAVNNTMAKTRLPSR